MKREKLGKIKITILEGRIERRTVKHAEALGILHLKLNVQGRRGWPDRLFMIKGGRPLLIEFKKLGKKPRRLQQHILLQLKELDYDVQYADTAEAGIAYIQAAYERSLGHKRLDSAQLPKARRSIPFEANIRGSVPRPRVGKDFHCS